MMEIFSQEFLALIDVPAGIKAGLMDEDPSDTVAASNQNVAEEETPLMDDYPAPPVLRLLSKGYWAKPTSSARSPMTPDTLRGQTEVNTITQPPV